VDVFRYEYSINALVAYVDRDPHRKTNTLLQDLPRGGSLDERITDIDSEWRADIVWVFRDLDRAMAAKYEALALALEVVDIFRDPGEITANGHGHTEPLCGTYLRLLGQDRPARRLLA
jgi:hypothetical protein